MIDQIPYGNIAQAGGGDIGTIADVAMAGKGLIAGGARLAARGAGDGERVAEAATQIARAGDGATGPAKIGDTASGAARQVDAFDRAADAVPIDMRQILDGHLSAKGKTVGFHARPGGVDPVASRLTQVMDPPNAAGVYVGKVEVRDPATGAWVAKKTNGGRSSFFPDRMSASDVETSVRHAYAEALRQNAVEATGRFVGATDQGFAVQGFVSSGNVTTAFPIYH